MRPKTICGKIAGGCFFLLLLLFISFFVEPVFFIAVSIYPITAILFSLAIFASIAGAWKESGDRKIIPYVTLFLSLPVFAASLFFRLFWSFGG